MLPLNGFASIVSAVRVTMSYGTQGLDLELPGDWDVTVLAKPPMPVLADPRAAVTSSLESPLGSGSLGEEARGRRSACILVCDVTRPVPNALVLRPLIERLLGAGLDPRAITILVATGLHRPNEGAELSRLIGDPWVLERVKVMNHLAREDGQHVQLGTSSLGIPIRLDRRFVEADVRIAVGLVEPRFMAGWSGGRKLVLPGIAHADAIAAFHAARMIGHARAATCTLDGNPLHETQLEALRMLGKVLGVNVVIDDRRRLSFASFGGIEESHAAAVRFADPYFRVPVLHSFPTVLASGAGFPLDATYYQAVKGICAGAAILEPGGELFVASACSEGFGSPEFRASQKLLRDLGKERFRAEAFGRAKSPIDEWETVMLLKALDAGRVHLFSEGLDGEDRELTGVLPCADLLGELGPCVARDPMRRIAIMPEGPYVAAEVKPPCPS
ncbi:MAG: nickel-dependent lactate racemase [Acidobacteria bacterium]|nr:nickel-dependent lactate racemase [Acidobacteriota bacterium]